MYLIQEQLTEFEHEPATLGERCTVTSAIVFCAFLLAVLMILLRIQGLLLVSKLAACFSYPFHRVRWA